MIAKLIKSQEYLFFTSVAILVNDKIVGLVGLVLTHLILVRHLQQLLH